MATELLRLLRTEVSEGGSKEGEMRAQGGSQASVGVKWSIAVRRGLAKQADDNAWPPRGD